MYKTDTNKKTEKITLVTFFVIFILGMLIFSFHTSPFYPYSNKGDSALFTLVGQGISEGKTLYTDLFDHKGPMLFFIEALGYCIGNVFGIFLIQCLFGVINLLFLCTTWKKINAYYKRPITNLIFSFIGGYAMFFYTFQGGNLSEEFSLPFISCCIYLFVSYAINVGTTPKHSYFYSFIYGVALMFLFLIRMNNAITVIAGIFSIFVYLLYRKEFKNLILNILSGIAGCLIVALPVFLYFFLNSAVYDMLYATFIYNFKYASNVGYSNILLNPVKYVVLYLPLICSIWMIVLRIIKHKTSVAFLDVLTIVIVLMNGLCLFIANQYPHYFTIYMPVFVLVLLQYQSFKLKSLKTIIIMLSIILNLYTALFSSLYAAYHTYVTRETSKEYQSVFSETRNIPTEERVSVIGYNLPSQYYIYADIVPCYKYYTHHDWWSVSDPSIKSSFIEWLKKEEPLWLLTIPDEDDSDLLEIISNKYVLESENEYITLYRIGE